MRQTRLPGLDFAADLETSIRILRENVPENGRPYYGLFSGGKDSVALKAVAELAGVPVEWHYNVTTIDPPELVKFIKKYHPDVKRDRPKQGNFFNRAVVKGFPTRRARWCCAEYKESTTPADRVLLMGIRAQESAKRRDRWGLIGEHWLTKAKVINPLYLWDDEDLWCFIRENKIPYCDLYDKGFRRLGCIGCPMGGAAQRKEQFKRWPKYEQKWRKTFRRIWERRSGHPQRDGQVWFGDRHFENWEEMFNWWLNDLPLPPKRSTD